MITTAELISSCCHYLRENMLKVNKGDTQTILQMFEAKAGITLSD